jgi:hypothetical protein
MMVPTTPSYVVQEASDQPAGAPLAMETFLTKFARGAAQRDHQLRGGSSGLD